MSTERTPGPWRSNERGEVYFQDPDPAVDARIVCESVARSADARLISAAPDLLAALNDVFELIDEGFLVRNTSRDADPLWALNSLRFVTRLKAAYDVFVKAGGR